MTYTKKQWLKNMNIYKELLINEAEEANELDSLDLVPSVTLLEECIEQNIEANLEANLEDINIELLIEDFIKLLAYKRELKKRANILEQKLSGGK